MTTQEPSWSAGRWLRVVAGVFAAQLFLAWILAERTGHPVREVKPLPPVALLTLPTMNQAVHQHPAVAGAALFALVDPRGFSGAAWLRIEPRDTPLTDWQEPEFWLSANPDRLGLPFQRFVQTNAPQLTSAATVPPFQRAPVALPPSPAPSISTFVVTGHLARRAVVTPPVLPLWPLSDTLRPTRVNVAVDASGEVFSAVQEAATQKSTDAAQQLADKKAVELVQQMRFAPSPSKQPASPIGSDLMWGTIVIRWQTVAPAITQDTPP